MLAAAPATPAQDLLSSIRASHACVRDFKLEAVRKDLREPELRRMKHGAAAALQFTKVKVYFKAPDRLRLEGRYGRVPLTMVENGSTKVYRFGLGIRRTRDVSDEPGKKQGGLEFGLLTGEVWQDYDVRIVGHERWEEQEAVVLELIARADRDGSYHRVWIDEETYRLIRRDRLGNDDALRHRHVFRQPYRTTAGTWLSRRIDVYNQHGQFTGALLLNDIDVNHGLAESLFRM
jgi:hypothetical protein